MDIYIPKKLIGNVEFSVDYPILFVDDFDDIQEECNLWITQERALFGKDKIPDYTWDLFDKIKKRTWWSDDNEENNE